MIHFIKAKECPVDSVLIYNGYDYLFITQGLDGVYTIETAKTFANTPNVAVALDEFKAWLERNASVTCYLMYCSGTFHELVHTIIGKRPIESLIND